MIFLFQLVHGGPESGNSAQPFISVMLAVGAKVADPDQQNNETDNVRDSDFGFRIFKYVNPYFNIGPFYTW